MRLSNHQTWARSREDLNFPRHFVFNDGRILLSLTQGRHTVYEITHFMQSEDGGQTWIPFTFPIDHHIHFFTRLNSGAVFCIGELGNPEMRYRDAFDAAITHDEGRNWHRIVLPFAGRPHRLYPFGNALELEDGTLLQGAYGRPGGSADDGDVYLLERKPGEQWLRVRSRVFVSGVATGWERTSECALALLGGGRMICIARTGNPGPLVQAFSDDSGQTWGPPRPLGGDGVAPSLHVSSGGELLLVCGRRREDHMYGELIAMTSKDGGESWSVPFVLHDGPGSSYACVTPIASGRFLVSYSEGVFVNRNLPQHRQDGELNRICGVTLELGV